MQSSLRPTRGRAERFSHIVKQGDVFGRDRSRDLVRHHEGSRTLASRGSDGGTAINVIGSGLEGRSTLSMQRTSNDPISKLQDLSWLTL